jgi:hypothetical protein
VTGFALLILLAMDGGTTPHVDTRRFADCPKLTTSQRRGRLVANAWCLGGPQLRTTFVLRFEPDGAYSQAALPERRENGEETQAPVPRLVAEGTWKLNGATLTMADRDAGQRTFKLLQCTAVGAPDGGAPAALLSLDGQPVPYVSCAPDLGK